MNVDYGPLACLVGTWTGDKGLDRSPEPDGTTEENPYFETILFEAIGDVTNAGAQTLSVLRYHQVASRKSDRKVFHNQTGYWSWDPKDGGILHSLTIPRGVCVLAAGKAAVNPDGSTVLELKAGPEGIVQSPFMGEKARTTGFVARFTVAGNVLTYAETTVLDVYGHSFDHTDVNVLTRTAREVSSGG